MALALSTITNSIAALSVSGLTIKDIDEIPEAWTLSGHVLYPEPVDLVTNFVAENASFGVGAGSSWNVEYDLTYTLLYEKLGSGNGLQFFSPAVLMGFAVMDAIMAASPLAGAVTVKPTSMSTPGPVSDPSGNMFYGMRITLHVLEFVN